MTWDLKSCHSDEGFDKKARNFMIFDESDSEIG